MTLAEILALIAAASQALPTLVSFAEQISAGKTVTKDEVAAALGQYGISHDTFAADLAAGK